mgnify:CR=1 FL=1
MTNTELKEALLNKQPVVLTMADGTELHCKYVNAIVYRSRCNSILVRAEVLDKNGNCVYDCHPKRLRYEV